MQEYSTVTSSWQACINNYKVFKKPFQACAWGVFCQKPVLKYFSKSQANTFDSFLFINPFLPIVPFWSPRKHKKTSGFLMFLGVSEGNIGKKRIKVMCLGYNSNEKSTSSQRYFSEFCDIFQSSHFIKYLWKAVQIISFNFFTGNKTAIGKEGFFDFPVY